MFRPFARLTALIFPAFTLAIAGVIVFAPISDDPVLALLDAPGCALPCFLGIRPGETEWPEAIAKLYAHPWVGQVTNLGNAVLWEWSTNAPVLLHAVRPSLMESFDNRVSYIEITTSIPLGDVWLHQNRQAERLRLQTNTPTFQIQPGVYGVLIDSVIEGRVADWLKPVSFILQDPNR